MAYQHTSDTGGRIAELFRMEPVSMAAHKTHTKKQTAALRLEIYQRYCCDQTQQAIAQALGMQQSNVAYHIAKARAAYQIEIESRRADRLAELDHLRCEAWIAWEADKSTAAVAFLAQIQKAIAQECALLGLNAPKSVSASVAFGELPHDTHDTVLGGLQEP